MANTAIGQIASTTGSALRRYFAVIGALLRFEQDSRRHAPMESILSLLEPVILVGSLSLVVWFLNRGRSPLHTDPVLFLTTGFFPVYFFMYISHRMRGAVSPHHRRFPVEVRLDHIIVHIITRIVDYIILGVVAFGLLYAFVSADAAPKNYMPILQAMVSCVMLGFGWGIFNIVVGKKIKIWHYFVPAINRHFIIVSGVLFIPDFLPPGVRYVLSFNPILHVVALFRQGFYPYYPTLLLDKQYLIFCSVFAVAVALVLERISRRHEEQ